MTYSEIERETIQSASECDMETKELLALARDASDHGDYKSAVGLCEQLLQQVMVVAGSRRSDVSVMQQRPQTVAKRRKLRCDEQVTRQLLLDYANALAHCRAQDVPLASAFQVYRQLLLNEALVDGSTMEKLLRNVTAALIERVRQRTRRKEGECDGSYSLPLVGGGDDSLLAVAAAANNDLEVKGAAGGKVEVEKCATETCEVDPLLCAVCEDLLKMPVTAQCGHTSCSKCVMSSSACSRCSREEKSVALTGTVVDVEERLEGLQKDVLISRLVDKWWGPELNANPLNEEAKLFLDAGQLDQALRLVNESLKQGEWGTTCR